MKYFLCNEHGEEFIMQSPSLEQAKMDVTIYGGVVVRELKPEEVD